jgi:hypothetical protein
VGTKLSPRDLELYRRVDEVLHYCWDPCEASREPQARDEYHAYLPQVFALVVGGADPPTIAEHLAAVERDRMGMPGESSALLPIGELLVSWRSQVFGAHA